jgi:hypothetical protein
MSVSLMHKYIAHPHSDEPSKSSTLLSRIFRTSRTKGAYLFDISACRDKYIDLQSMMFLKQQHPQVHAFVTLNDGPRRYLEFYVTKKNEINDIANTGIDFPESKLKVLYCTAIDESAQIINLKLSSKTRYSLDSTRVSQYLVTILDVSNFSWEMVMQCLTYIKTLKQINSFKNLAISLAGVSPVTKRVMPSLTVLSQKRVLFATLVINRAIAHSSARVTARKRYLRRISLTLMKNKPMIANRPLIPIICQLFPIKEEDTNEDDDKKIEPEEVALLKEDQNNFTASIENQLPLSVHCDNEKLIPEAFTDQLSMAYDNYHRVRTSGSTESTCIAKYQAIVHKQRKAMGITK